MTISIMRLLSILFVSVLIQFKVYGQFKQGYYFKSDGTRVPGLIRFNYGGHVFTDKSDGDCSITFKAKKRDKKVNLTTRDICCFVIEKDSFAIIKNFRLNALSSYPQDFAKVLETGKINLYLYYSKVQSGGKYPVLLTVTDWVIEKNGKADKLTKKKFKELIPMYLQDHPELLNRIKNDELGHDDTEMIVKAYNDFWKKK